MPNRVFSPPCLVFPLKEKVSLASEKNWPDVNAGTKSVLGTFFFFQTGESEERKPLDLKGISSPAKGQAEAGFGVARIRSQYWQRESHGAASHS